MNVLRYKSFVKQIHPDKAACWLRILCMVVIRRLSFVHIDARHFKPFASGAYKGSKNMNDISTEREIDSRARHGT